MKATIGNTPHASARDLVLAAWILWCIARANAWERERYEARAVVRAIRWSTLAERRKHARALVRSAVTLAPARRAFCVVLAGLLLASFASTEGAEGR